MFFGGRRCAKASPPKDFPAAAAMLKPLDFQNPTCYIEIS